MSAADAIAAVKMADGVWNNALSESRNASPNAGFAQRVRTIGDAAEQMHAALEGLIAVGGKTKRPDVLREFPHEVTDKAYRPGDPQLWIEWDAAVKGWQLAMMGTSFPDVAKAVAPIAQLAHRLADSIEADRGAGEQRSTGTGR